MDLAHEKLVIIKGGNGFGINNHASLPNLEIANFN